MGSIASSDIPPRIMREFRGAWIASVSNIDWPSKKGLPVEEQKKELIALLDKAAELRLNAIILQIRPACDAFYPSSIEPWSEYLTGKMGQKPAPVYDPLKFAIDESHARGLELHAWFNPYRAGFASWKYISPNHISKTRPHLVRKYGKYLWLDPAEKAVQDYTTSVILDVVRRYDIDGVHMDDYFYPYPERDSKNAVIDFPDEGPWKKYRASGGKLARDDWRRQNVNTLIQRLHREIKREKPWVTFGVSPFGIWRPGHPAQIKGFDAYQQLYADAREWLVQGWVDYLAPQLYWQIDPPAQSYSALYNWWQEQNTKNIPIWPGGAVTRVAGKRWPAGEIVRQIEIPRASPSPGHIHWNLTSVMKNPDNLQEKLLRQSYQEAAVVPILGKASSTLPKPTLKVSKDQVRWDLPSGANKVHRWIVQTRTGSDWKTEILPKNAHTKVFSDGTIPETIVVSALDRFRVASPAALAALR